MKKFAKRIISLFLATIILFNGQIAFAFSDTEYDKKAFNSFFEEELQGIENPDEEELTEVPEDIEIGEEDITDITEEDNPDLEEFIRIPFENFDINPGASAPSLINGQTITKTLETGETHTYKITVPYKAEFTVTLSSPLNMYLYLTDSNEKTITYTNGTGQKKITRLSESGTYYIKVSGNKGDYGLTFTINTTEDKHSDTIENATELINEETCKGIIDYSGDIDYFMITIPYKAECTITLSADARKNLYLNDNNDKNITYDTYVANQKKISRLLEPGTYYVKISGNKGDYELTFTLDTTEDKHSNTIENATELINKETQDGIIDYSGDVDYFVFTVPYKAECTISLSADVRMHLYLNDNNDRNITYDTYVANQKKISRFLEPGTYYIKVNGNKGNYDMTFTVDTTEDKHSNTIENATELISGETCAGRIDYAGDIDYFVFTVPYKAECTIMLSTPQNMNLYLNDKNDKNIIYVYGTAQKTINKLLEPGTYYVKISREKGDYGLTFTIDTTDDDCGDTIESAIELKNGKSQDARIDYQGDMDYFMFSVPYKAECTITLTTTASMRLRLNDSKDVNIVDLYGGTGEKTISRLLEPGTYYVRVNGNKDDYNLKFTINTTEDEYSDTAANATKLINGEIKVGRINYPGDMDYFMFTVPYKAECTITLTTPASMRLRLNDSKDVNIVDVYGGTVEKTISRLLDPGTYYVRVNGNKDDYNLKFTINTTEDTQSNTIDDARFIQSDVSYDGIINYTGDIDFFKINIPCKAECIIEISAPLSVSINLYDVNGNSTGAGVSGTSLKLVRNVNANTYYIRVYGSKGNNNYTIRYYISGAGKYANKIKPPPEVNITRDDVAADVVKGLYTWEDFNYLVALCGEALDYEGFYAVACCVRNRVKSSAFKEFNSYKETASDSSQFRGFKREYIGSFDNQHVTNAAVAVLRGGASIIGDYCYFFGKATGQDLWFELTKAGSNKPIVIGVGSYRNVYHSGGYLHNAKSTKTSDAIILYNTSTGKWYDQ